jgi:hypothetical protein
MDMEVKHSNCVACPDLSPRLMTLERHISDSAHRPLPVRLAKLLLEMQGHAVEMAVCL